MYQLEFTTAHSYGSDRCISVPVLLKSGPNSVRIAASIDTGATFFCEPAPASMGPRLISRGNEWDL
jgi:hypothetical protein